MKIFVETGKKKVFVGAIEWPGFCRSGRNEDTAISELKNYGVRYAEALDGSELDFKIPDTTSDFLILERHEGNATTDFGAPSKILDVDSEPINKQDFEHFHKILTACWRKLDKVVEEAKDKELRKGPRGGGRDLEKILSHVHEVNQVYAKRLAWTGKNCSVSEINQTWQDIMNTFQMAEQLGLPEKGPRGGEIWKPRYFVRRIAWHVLDHAWEIEDRMIL